MTAPSPPPARNLVLAFFHAASDRALDVGTLVAATSALGLTGNSTRVTLSRLLSEGWISRDDRGRYRLRSERAAASSGLVSFKEIPNALRAWKGGWIGCVFEPQGGRAPVLPENLRRLGFREATPGLAVRPDNLRGGTALLDARVGAARLLKLEPIGKGDATEHWPALWAPQELSRDYLRMLQLIRKSRAKLPRLSPQAQLAATFEVARSCIAQLEQDPLLPEEWVGGPIRETVVDELVVYDRDSRALWMEMIPGLELAGSLRASAPWSPGGSR